MAALVQGYPRQSGTATMLQTRPASSTGIIQPAQSQSNSQYGHNMSQRNSIHGMSGVGGAPVVYRPASSSVQQYAFTNAPASNHGQHHHQFRQHRTSSTPSVPQVQHFDQSGARPRYQSSNSMTNLPNAATISGQSAGGSRDDSAIPVGSRRVAPLPRPHSAHLGETFSVPLIASAGPAKVSPERYRRPAQRANESASGMSNTSEQKSGMLRGPNGSVSHRPNSFVGSLGGSAVDDMLLPHGQVREDVKRARRRSMPALDSPALGMPLTPLYAAQPAKEIKPSGRTVNNLSVDRVAAHTRTSSTDSRSSSRSTGSSGTRPASVSYFRILIHCHAPHLTLSNHTCSRPVGFANSGFLLPSLPTAAPMWPTPQETPPTLLSQNNITTTAKITLDLSTSHQEDLLPMLPTRSVLLTPLLSPNPWLWTQNLSPTRPLVPPPVARHRR